jgi:hypothetical protein
MHGVHWTLNKITWKLTAKPLTWTTIIYTIQTGRLVCFSEPEQIIFKSPSRLCCLENVEASTSHDPWVASTACDRDNYLNGVTPWRGVHKKQSISELLRNSQYFMEPEMFITVFTRPATSPYPQPDESSPRHPILYF